MHEARRIANTREHLSWASRFAVFWLILALGVFAAAYLVAEYGEVAHESHAIVFIILATIIVINTIWQAAALALARLENVVLPRSR